MTSNTSYKKHLLNEKSSIKEALVQLDSLARNAIIFVVDDHEKLLGSITDGDIRRSLIKDFSINDCVVDILQTNPKFIRKGSQNIQEIKELREKNFRILPILDQEDKIVNVINFRNIRSYLPIDAVLMAGGKGTRLRPLTLEKPKPLLLVGDKPIIEHNIDRLSIFGIDDFWISVKYLGNQIQDYFQNGEHKNISIEYVWEDEELGTIGAVSKIKNFKHDTILVTNSDILTNLDYEQFYLDFIHNDADFSVVTIPYNVSIPYAVLETHDNQITSFKEKPTYTYYSNGGIYLMKKSMLDYLPENSFFNATDLMEKIIERGKKVVSYPLVGYWLDVGKHEDFAKAQEDIKQIKF